MRIVRSREGDEFQHATIIPRTGSGLANECTASAYFPGTNGKKPISAFASTGARDGYNSVRSGECFVKKDGCKVPGRLVWDSFGKTMNYIWIVGLLIEANPFTVATNTKEMTTIGRLRYYEMTLAQLANQYHQDDEVGRCRNAMHRPEGEVRYVTTRAGWYSLQPWTNHPTGRDASPLRQAASCRESAL